jgi:hypothetical protein
MNSKTVHGFIRASAAFILLLCGTFITLYECTSANAKGKQISTPSMQAYNIALETQSGGGCVGYCYAKGNGEFRMIIANPDHAVDILPTDGAFVYYDGAGSYANGYDLGNGNKILWIDFNESADCNFLCDLPQFPVYVRIVEFNYDFDNDYAYFLTSVATNNPVALQ